MICVKVEFEEEVISSICIEGPNDCPSCLKEHIDLREIVGWETQINKITKVVDGKVKEEYESYRQCFDACKAILINAGLSSGSAMSDMVIQVATQISNVEVKDRNDQNKYLEINAEKAIEGLEYIDEQLSLGYPILVGVDYKYGSSNKDNVTDHFVVIVGRGCKEDNVFYYFYEVGTYWDKKGMSDENKLYLENDNNSLRGKPFYDTRRKYVVSQVRRNKLS
jgi:hypothetical protein